MPARRRHEDSPPGRNMLFHPISGIFSLICSPAGPEYSKARRVPFFTAGAHQLHAYAYSEYGLPQRRDNPVESCPFQRFHGRSRFSHTGKDDPVCRTYDPGVGSHGVFGPEPFQGVFHRTQVSGSIVYYRRHIIQINDCHWYSGNYAACGTFPATQLLSASHCGYGINGRCRIYSSPLLLGSE